MVEHHGMVCDGAKAVVPSKWLLPPRHRSSPRMLALEGLAVAATDGIVTDDIERHFNLARIGREDA